VAGTKASCFEVRKTDLFGAFNPAGLTSSAIEAVTLTKNGETLTPELTTEPPEPDQEPTADAAT